MTSATSLSSTRVAIIGGGPAGLMAAETISHHGMTVDLFDAMPSFGRKLLLAGKGGLNLTHSESTASFRARYGMRQDEMGPLLAAFGAPEVRAWAQGLGVNTFVGSSGRVFPTDMKAAPLLRAWLQRLRSAGVRFHVRHRWSGWRRATHGHTQLEFATPEGDRQYAAEAVVLALGGGSWPRLGSDGRWFALLEPAGIPLAALRPANCGFDAGWSRHLREHFAGAAIKSVVASFVDSAGVEHRRPGECVLTVNGLEGSLIYALSAALRDGIETSGSATLRLDLLPNRELVSVVSELARPRGSRSMASHLQSRLRLKGAKAALLHECTSAEQFADPQRLGAAIKSLPIRLVAPRPLAEAISSAGGVRFPALDGRLMLRALPGVFCAGEMLDWEAPTGGYLLTACFSSGRAAGLGVLAWLAGRGQSAGAPPHLPRQPP